MDAEIDEQRSPCADADMFEAFQSSGCKDEKKIVLAEKVYRDLLEGVKVKELERMYDEGMDLIYFRVVYPTSEQEVVVPCSSTTPMDMGTMEEIQRRLGGNIKCFTMAVVDLDATVIYYTVTNGLIGC